jgi:large subunit ribosomal protein L10
MAINKVQKSELISTLKEKFSTSSFVVVVHYRGMNGKQLYDLRVNLKSKGCGMKITKNTIAEIAIKGTDLEVLSSYLNGPTAILYSKDPVALAKIVSDVAKEVESLKIRIGYLDKLLIKESDIGNLAKLGSLEEVRASFLGTLSAAQSNFVKILGASQFGLVSLLSNYAASKKE